jgi:ketosteroid isomerase-like protein
MPDRERDREEIIETLKAINIAWTKGDIEELNKYFHEDMIIAQPGFGIHGEGKNACVDSYREFAGMARIHRLTESQHVVLVWGDTAVASYRFDVDYELDGQPHQDAGYDLFVFNRTGGDWLAVWRTILPVPEAAQS